ncbi:hypothetical protein R1sor_024880 [Riccia sorocarpa]|uniref:Uncharacterized protein n=1 Tax=Riccia sorocarpa TaxID=122646 RepID=A0ABD3GVQ9_9MARC
MASLSSVSLHSTVQLPAQLKLSSPVHSVATDGSVSSSTVLSFALKCSQRNGSAAKAPRMRLPVTSLRAVICLATASSTDIPTVAETKRSFLENYRRPIPSIYSTVIQELLVQHHLLRYNTTYQYDPVFALGFVTVYDQLMDGYPSAEDRDAIFKAYISALKENPEHYRSDAKKLEAWASEQSATSVVSFSGEGEVESILKDIAERAAGKGSFHYSRFFAIGLFRLLEVAKASDPAVLEQLAKALNVNKLSIDRDLDVYRNLLSKLAQGKELIREYVEREKKKAAERESSAPKKAEEVAKTEGKSE